MTRSPSSPAREALVAALRQQLAAATARCSSPDPQLASGGVLSSGCPPLDAILPRRGWERGSLVEWLAEHPGSGAGTLAWLAAREAAREGGMVVVIDRLRQFYPPAAVAWGIDCGQLLIVQPADAADELWALDQALRSPAIAAVWAPLGKLDPRQYRRLQLAAEEGRTLGLLVRSTRCRGEPTWADVQLVVEPLASKPHAPLSGLHAPREDVITRSVMLTNVRSTLSARRLRVIVARCPGGAAERAVELRIEDFTGAITAAKPTTGQREGPSHETPARPPLSAVGFATGYRRPSGA